MSLRRTTTIVVAGLALIVSGCGSDDDEQAEPPRTVAEQPAATESAPAATKSAPVTIPIKDFKYVPPSVTVKAGTTVTFVNEDRAPHTATVTGGGFDTDTLRTDERGKVRITKPGTYDYICELHPYMKGTIVAR